MEVKGKVKTTVKTTVSVKDKTYELSCTAYGTVVAPVTYYQRARIRWDADDSYPEEVEADYDNAEYEWDDEEWEWDDDFERNFKDYDELQNYLSTVKDDIMSEVYENFTQSEVTEEQFV